RYHTRHSSRKLNPASPRLLSSQMLAVIPTAGPRPLPHAPFVIPTAAPRLLPHAPFVIPTGAAAPSASHTLCHPDRSSGAFCRCAVEGSWHNRLILSAPFLIPTAAPRPLPHAPSVIPTGAAAPSAAAQWRDRGTIA